MKNLYHQEAVDEILARIHALKPDSQKQWGKMNVAQMLAHCTGGIRMATGELNIPLSFIGRSIGPFFKFAFTNDKPFPKSASTAQSLMITDERDFDKEKEILIRDIKNFSSAGPEKCTKHPHPFFGKLTPTQWGTGAYKHLDHHLRQFSA